MNELINQYREAGEMGLMFFVRANYSGKDKEPARAALLRELTGTTPKKSTPADVEEAVKIYILTPKLF